MNKKITLMTFGAIAIVLIATLTIISVPQEDKTIGIGSILILSGGGSAWGEAAQRGISFAVKDLNSNGGVLGKELVVNFQDDQGKPANTVTIFQELTDVEGLDFIIGPSWSLQGLSVKPLIDDEVVISPSLGSKEFNEGNEFAFNTRQHDYILAQNLAKLVFEKGHRSVAILSVNDPYNVEQADEFQKTFEALGGIVEIVFDPLMEQRDMRTDLLKIKDNKNVDALIATSGGTVLTSLYGRQVKELGISQPVFSLTIDQTVIKNSAGGTDGWLFLSAFTPSEEFSTRYLETFGTDVHIGSDSAYDAVMMLAQAMEETQSTDPVVVKEYLNSMKTFSGVSGDLVADGEGGFTKNYIVNMVVEGRPVQIEG